MSVNQPTMQKVVKLIWEIGQLIRGQIDLEDLRHIVLPLFFLKALSDQYADEHEDYLKEYRGDAKLNEEDLSLFRYVIPSEANFSFILESSEYEDHAGRLLNAFRLLEQNNPELKGLFSDAEFIVERLRSKNSPDYFFIELLELFYQIDLRPAHLEKGTKVTDIFLQVIQFFASASGKKSGEYYTPQMVTSLLAKLLEPCEADEIYDPACGSGSLLISLLNNVSESMENPLPVSLFGQEINISTYNLAKMNLILNSVYHSYIEPGDSIKKPAFLDADLQHLKKFDVVVSNPPFSLNYHGYDWSVNDTFDRFKWGIPPKSKGDYVFISHMLSSLKEGKGRMAVVVPHGVLFRGAAEGKIRTNIIKDNLLDAVIGLPHNLFFGTNIPVAIMFFRKDKTDKSVFFIDASKEFLAEKSQNFISEMNVSKILEAFKAKTELEGYSRNVLIEEIIDNDFNLNISRYIDDFKEEDDINLKHESMKREELQYKLKTLEFEMDNILSRINRLD